MPAKLSITNLAFEDGRLCKWVSRLDSVDPDAYDEFQQYKKTLKLECSPGTPGTFQWTPGKSAGDMAFYQVDFHFR